MPFHCFVTVLLQDDHTITNDFSLCLQSTARPLCPQPADFHAFPAILLQTSADPLRCAASSNPLQSSASSEEPPAASQSLAIHTAKHDWVSSLFKDRLISSLPSLACALLHLWFLLLGAFPSYCLCIVSAIFTCLFSLHHFTKPAGADCILSSTIFVQRSLLRACSLFFLIFSSFFFRLR